MSDEKLREDVKAFRFREALAGVGWNPPKIQPFDRLVGNVTYRLTPIAEQGGIHAFEVSYPEGSPEPDNARRKSIDSAISAEFNRNLLIFVNRERTAAHIQGVIYRDGKRLVRGFPYQVGRPTEPVARLFKELEIPYGAFDERGEVGSSIVIDALEGALRADKVTKKFFKEFSDKRKAFVRFLEWIEDESKREWYCSVLLNRLMFISFIAERGFLPGGKHYLSNRLRENAEANGPNTYYTHFLLPLSFFGLGKPKGKRGRFEESFNGVLYLDGGLFATHSVEKELGITAEAVETGDLPSAAAIPDAEFKKWFDYFDAWRWTLDEEKYENDISPHILGYIFEKYVNQKQMGAYYTKEDITGYICRNTIIPRLFDMLAEESDRTGDPRSRQAVDPLPIGPHPNLLNKGLGVSQGEGIDRYIYPAVKQVGLLKTETGHATETEYEYKQRQKRYESILQDFDDGKIAQINDFITYNLDIERLSVDFVATIQDPEVLWALWDRCLTKITVLDPTCGSGAFLFAALKILFPLYYATLKRMEELLKARGEADIPIVTIGGKYNFPEVQVQPELPDLSYSSGKSENAYSRFQEVLREVTKDHPHADYFIKKKIIVQNLYGVDIMEEAVEICKLRLFLELMRTVEKDDSKPNFGVEPLPDIDFNILAGNTLVGYTSIEDIDRLWRLVEKGTITQTGSIAYEKDHSRLCFLKEQYAKLLEAWRLQQLGEWNGKPVSKEQVQRAAEAELRPELNKDLWRLYRTANVLAGGMTLVAFERSHQPFHWLIEFPEISARGGFDVVVGNPPYVKYPSDDVQYSFIGFALSSLGNLYAPILEAALRTLRRCGRVGQIVPMSITSIREYRPLRQHLEAATAITHISNHAIRPLPLFTGVSQRLSIVLGLKDVSSNPARLVTGYLRTLSLKRLFEGLLPFVRDFESEIDGIRPKLSTNVEHSLLTKLLAKSTYSNWTTSDHGAAIWFKDYGETYWVFPTSFTPFRKPVKSFRTIATASSADRDVLVAALNSTTFYWFYNAISDCWHLGAWHIKRFPIGLSEMSMGIKSQLRELKAALESSLIANRRERYDARVADTIYEYQVSRSKSVLDEIDCVLAKHYGFTEEELEFIINYDLKYRVGRDAEPSDED